MDSEDLTEKDLTAEKVTSVLTNVQLAENVLTRKSVQQDENVLTRKSVQQDENVLTCVIIPK
jgi:hypothetical protein